MKKMITLALAALLATSVSWANDAAFHSDPPDEYVVVKGDTLWDISNRFLEAPWLWPEVWHANPQIENPHLIYPGDVVRLVYIDGEPRLTVDRTVHMSPPEDGKLRPRIRELPNEEAIPAISLDRIASFLSNSRIVEPGILEGAPYMLAGPEDRVIVGAGDRAYARGAFDEEHRSYGVFRKGDPMVDPETGELLGVHALEVGRARLREVDGEVATMFISRSNEEIRPGDRLLISEERPVSSVFFPSEPPRGTDGVIMAVEGGVTQIGRMHVVMINRGTRDDLSEGNVLSVYRRGERVRDRVAGGEIDLPDERAGLLMVFRTFEKMSFGLVLEATRPLSVGDRLRMP